MSESVEIAQRLDAIYDTELTNRLVSSLSSPSYTLADLQRLGREYSDQCRAEDDSVIAGLVLSQFTRWLAKKEREANG